MLLLFVSYMTAYLGESGSCGFQCMYFMNVINLFVCFFPFDIESGMWDLVLIVS